MGEMKYLSETDPDFKEIKQEWFNKAGDIKTTEDLTEFARHLLTDFHLDYGAMVSAVGALAVAGASLGSYEYGLTGFQASLVMWEFIFHWLYNDNKCGMKLTNYDEFLYPQYEYKFEKTISEYTWEEIQKEAANRLRERTASPSVVRHWESIVAGNVPFGYTVV